jgi:hypothetical protein
MQVSANRPVGSSIELLVPKRTSQPSSAQPTPARVLSDRVTLSPEALSRASEAPSPAPIASSSFSAVAHADASKAEAFARDFAYTEDRAGMDISGLMPGGDGVLRYSSTGKPVTPESEAAFAQEASRVRAERIALYQDEKAKGTAAADIFDKIAAYMSTQSGDYLRDSGWDRVIAG